MLLCNSAARLSVQAATYHQPTLPPAACPSRENRRARIPTLLVVWAVGCGFGWFVFAFDDQFDGGVAELLFGVVAFDKVFAAVLA